MNKKHFIFVIGTVLTTAGSLYWITLLFQSSFFTVGTAMANLHWLLAEVVAIPHAILGVALIAYSKGGD